MDRFFWDGIPLRLHFICGSDTHSTPSTKILVEDKRKRLQLNSFLVKILFRFICEVLAKIQAEDLVLHSVDCHKLKLFPRFAPALLAEAISTLVAQL